MAGAGPAIIFVCLLVATGLVAVAVAAQTAYYFLGAVDDTAGGMDEVIWGSDPLLDRLGHVVHLFWLVAFWLVPVGFLTRLLANNFLPDQGLLRFFILAVPLFWLLFPISL